MKSAFIGKVVDHYRIIENLGIGGMGVVFKAINININKLVALKMIAPGLAMNPNFIKRFQTEAKALAKLNDINIVSITDLRIDNDNWFIVMEYVDGVNLYDKIKKEGRYKCDESIPILKQILSAIGHAHKAGIIHRDIKPNNIMVTKDGVVKITDFGLAKDQTMGASTVSIASGGTLYYMSPEHVKGFSFTDKRSDLYSVGMTYYEMITGKVPFQNINSDFDMRERIIRKNFEKPSFFNKDIPPGLEAIVMKSIAKDPDMRYQSAEEMLAAIEKFEASLKAGKPEAFEETELAIKKPKKVKTKKISKNKTPTRHKLAWGFLFIFIVFAGFILFPDFLNQPLQTNVSDQNNLLADSLDKKSETVSKPITESQTIAEKPEELRAEPNRKNEITAPVSNAELIIRSNPSVAQVRLNGDFMGTTPLSLKKLKSGNYRLNIRKSGYKPYQQNIRLAETQSKTVNARLNALTGKLELSMQPDDALIFLDGKQVEPDQLNKLTLGKHQIRIEKAGYSTFEKDLEINSAGNEQLNVDLVPLQLNLSVRVNPWGSIFIDGKLHKADTDIKYKTGLKAGKHTIRVEHPIFGAWQKEIEMFDEDKDILVDFSETRAIRIKAMDQNGQELTSTILIDNQNTEHQTPGAVMAHIGFRKIRVQKEGYREVSGEKTILIDNQFNDELVFILQQQ